MNTTKMIPIADLVADYANLEREIHPEISAMSSAICAACEDPCCKPEHCSALAESVWLQRVARTADASLPELDSELDFLGPRGCTLKVGRPVHCTWYICDRLSLKIDDPLDRFLYQILSNLLGHIIRDAQPDRDLVDVEDLEDLTERQRVRLKRRIDTARQCLTVVKAMRAEAESEKPVRCTAEQILYLARAFPFAARQVRFDGEQPSLSRAGRKRLAT